MRLSTAIRIGSMTTKQIRVKFSDGGNGRCALGAALDACNIPIIGEGNALMSVWDTWNYTASWVRVPCLVDDRFHMGALREVITTLNDVAGWSREQIADWVEKIEDQWGITSDGKLPNKEVKKDMVNVNG